MASEVNNQLSRHSRIKMDNRGFTCQVCELSFDTAEEQRQHAKSEWHVYKIRCRVAPAGVVIPPPETHLGQGPSIDGAKQIGGVDKYQFGSLEDGASDEETEGDEEDSDDEQVVPEFVPEECLFCNQASESFHDNSEHMLKAHSLVIPHRESLAVEPQTLVWYLHLVIYGYHECIQCGKRCRTTQAVQQHMISKGHCRFDVSDEFADFYDLDSMTVFSPNEYGAIGAGPLDDASLRLPSGKLLNRRSHSFQPREPKVHSAKQSVDPSRTAPQSRNAHGTSSGSSTDIVNSDHRKHDGLALQLSSLSMNDRRSLAHLSNAEQRSALVTRKKQIDKARREEMRVQSKVERLGNKNLMKHFKNDVPGRPGG